jgi:hypothetical protein
MLGPDRHKLGSSCETLLYFGNVTLPPFKPASVFELPGLLSTNMDINSVLYPPVILDKPIKNSPMQQTTNVDVIDWNLKQKQYLLPPSVYLVATSESLSLYFRQRPIDMMYSNLYLQVFYPPEPQVPNRQLANDSFSRQPSGLDRGTEFFHSELRYILIGLDPQETTTLLLHIVSQNNEMYFIPRTLLNRGSCG